MKTHFLNLIAAGAVLFAAGSALAEYSHVPLKRVEGIVVHSSTSVSNLILEEGQYTSCAMAASGLQVTKCQLENARMTLTSASGEITVVPLSNLTYYKSSAGDQLFNHYIFKGIWQVTQNGRTLQSDIAINVIHVGTDTPGQIRGYISMNDLNISEQLRGQAFPH